jgi:multiple sugar transport system permease protein
MLDPTLGVIPRLAGMLGIDTLDVLGSPMTALPGIAGIDSWWQTGFVFIILCAGLAALPEEPYEAANIDGASSWQRFRYITIPQLLPLVLTVAAIRAVECLKVFALIFGTTNGGPLTSTMSSQMLTYRTAFREFGMSESMTMMITYALVIVIVVGVALGIQKVVNRAR